MKVLLGILVCLAYVLSPAECSKKYVGCYFASWTYYRPGNGKFLISDIDVSLCTHIYYAFVGLNSDGSVHVLDPWRDNDDGLKGFREFLDLKKKRSSLKLIISMGGWNEGSERYSEVAADPKLRKNMVNSVVDFVNTWGFDGFDLDWEYPGIRDGSNPTIDKGDLSLLLEELNASLKAAGKTLSMAVSPAKEKIAISYDIPKLNKYLDWINVMAYDFHGSFDNFVGHVAPLYPSSLDDAGNATYTVAAGIQEWLNGGADPCKIILGIPAYGRSFTLADKNQTGLYAPIKGGGTAGPYSALPGTLDYKEICEFDSNWKYVWDSEQKVPHIISGEQWVGFDDVRSIKLKADFAKKKHLGGIMVWAIDGDDFKNICGHGKYPLLNAINKNLY